MSDGKNARLLASLKLQVPYALRNVAARFEAASNPDVALTTLTEVGGDLRDWQEGLRDTREPRLPRPMGVEDLLLVEEPEEDWLAEGFLPAGGNILCAAYPKSFKTLSVLEIAVGLTTGTPVFGRFRVPRCRRIGIVLMEDQAHRIRYRLQRLCQGRGIDLRDLAGRLYLWFRPPIRLLDGGIMNELGVHARDLDLDILAVDSWSYVASGDSNSADEVTPQLMALSGIREHRPGTTTWLTHHAAKSLGRDTRDQRITDIIRNSSAFGAWYEAGLLLERASEDSNVVQIGTELRDGEPPPAFAVTVEDEHPAGPDRPRSTGWLRMTADDGDPAVALRRETADKLVPAVRNYIRAHPGCSKRQLREGVRGRSGDKDAALQQLLDGHEVTVGKQGKASALRLAESPQEGRR